MHKKRLRRLYRDIGNRYYYILTAIRLRFHRSAPVFIYTMGKVGSSSIRESLKKNYAGVVAHGHSFSLQWKSTAPVKALYHWYHKNEKKEINIISLVRDPITRNISLFFQEYQKHQGFTGNETIDELLELFLNFPSEPAIWFDRKLKPIFGIDVYQYDFNDYAVIKKGRINLLLMKCELSDQLKTEIIGNFLGTKELVIMRTNESKIRKYSELYDAFKKVKMPREYVEKVCSSRYYKHFYRDISVQDQIKKWCM